MCKVLARDRQILRAVLSVTPESSTARGFAWGAVSARLGDKLGPELLGPRLEKSHGLPPIPPPTHTVDLWVGVFALGLEPFTPQHPSLIADHSSPAI